jgi:hypothetical protein
MAQLQQLIDRREVHREHVERAADEPLGEKDGPEFSSGPMPAAYGVFYSAALGLVCLIIVLAILW